MDLTFTDVIISHLRDLHPSDLLRIKAAISGIISNKDELLKEAKIIKEEKSNLHAVKFLRDSGSSNTLGEDLEIVKSL